MNKKVKKLISATTSVTSAAVAIVPTATLITSNKNEISKEETSTNGESVIRNGNNTNSIGTKIEFNGKYYDSVEEAANDYINTSGNVEQKTFIGDVDAAISNSSPYKNVDLSKLRENDPTRLSAAYKKLSGQYTIDENDAKSSYIKDPQIKFVGANGKIFDLKSDAEESLLKSKQTSSITYYEVADHNKLDLYGNPRIVKINPLNKNDQETLKKIALGNVSVRKENEFSIERMTVNTRNNLYDVNDYKGMAVNDYLNNISKFKKILANKVRDKLWVSPELSATAEQRVMKGTIVGGFVAIDSQFGVNYTVHANQNNKYAGLSLSDLKKQSKILYDKNEFDKHFERTYDNYNRPTGNTALYRNAKTKNYISQNPISSDWPSTNININTGMGNGLFPGIINPTIQKGIFGGQEYSFTLDNSKFIQTNFGNSMSEEAISFAGHGKKNNVWFNMGINQEGLEHQMSTNPEYRLVAEKTTWSIINEFVEELRKDIDSNLDYNLVNNLKESLYKPIYQALTTKIINNGEYVIWNLRNSETIENITASLNDRILYNINDLLSKSNNNSLENLIGGLFQRHKMSTENPSNLSTIYTISYNGVPLFRLGKEIIQLFSDSIEFKSDPLKTIRQGIKDLLISNFDGTIAKFLPNMHNVSNMLSKQKTEHHKLSNKLDANYVQSNNSQNVDNNTVSFVNGEIDPSWGLSDNKVYLDEKMIGQLGFQESSVNRQLNLFESDGIDTLKMNGGTWASIRQYNKELKNALSTKEPSQAYRDNVLKNKISDLNDVVHLFEKDSTPKDIYYAEYLNYNSTFNPSLSNNSTTIVSSKEKRDYVVKLHGLNDPSRVMQVQNHNNHVLVNVPIVDNSQEAIESAKQLAIKQALNDIDISYDQNYVYYKETSGVNTLLKNEKSQLYTLNIKDNSGISKGVHGFVDYSNMYNYLVDYIKYEATGSSSNVVDFNVDSINPYQIEKVLNTYATLDDVNNASNTEKFEKFGSIFGIHSQDNWDSIINTLTFEYGHSRSVESNNQTTKSGTPVSMVVTLKNGYIFQDATTIMRKNVNYNPGLFDLPDGEIDSIQRNASNATIIGVSAAILSIIILEIVVIVTMLVNRRNNENKVEEKLVKLSSYRSSFNSSPNVNLNTVSKEVISNNIISKPINSPMGGMPTPVSKPLSSSSITKDNNKKDTLDKKEDLKLKSSIKKDGPSTKDLDKKDALKPITPIKKDQSSVKKANKKDALKQTESIKNESPSGKDLDKKDTLRPKITTNKESLKLKSISELKKESSSPTKSTPRVVRPGQSTNRK